MRFNRTCMTMGFLVMISGAFLLDLPAFGAVEKSDCLECHGEPSIIEQGGRRLYIDPVQFEETSHKVNGCDSCHDTATLQHPDDASRPGHLMCAECHDTVAREYTASRHNRNAACSDCHNPHQARKTSTLSGVEINAICSRCHTHANTLKSHEKWLPQTALHLDVQPCITCHTGSNNYFINLFIEKDDRKGGFRLATYDELTRLTRDSGLPSLIDANGDNYISLQELRNANKKGRSMGMRLRALLMPEKMTHSYQILDNRRDCSFCHVSGTRNMQTGFVSFPTDSGSYIRVPVEKGAVLDILYGTPDFYITGATRSTALSIIGAVIIACGIIIPMAHGTLRFLTRRRRARKSNPAAKEVVVYMQPTPVRIWHWIHVLSIVTLCLTGLQMRFPDVVNLFGGYKAAVYLHNTAGIVVAVSMVYWVLYYAVISRSIGRIYFPNREDIRHGLVRQALYYAFNYFRGRPNPFHATPENKFNALQKSAYLVIMFVFMPLVIATGMLLLDILPLRSMLFRLGGIKLIDGLHFLSACCLCAFGFFHFYLTTLGLTPFAEIRTMWTGWDREEAAEETRPPKDT